MYEILFIRSEWAYFEIDFCYFKSFTNVQTDSYPLVEPVRIFGADPGMLPIRGLKSTLQIFAGDFRAVISEQNYGWLG
jgi:hypothetical protein